MNDIDLLGAKFQRADFTGTIIQVKDGIATLKGENRNGKVTLNVAVEDVRDTYFIIKQDDKGRDK